MDDADLEIVDPIAVHEAEDSLRVTFDGEVSVIEAVAHHDPRGKLIAFDPAVLPFAVRRIFTVSEVPAGTIRGRHAHRRGAQALFCVAGRVDVGLRRGTTSHALVTLTAGSPGICISGGVWSQQHYVVDGSSLLVMASDPYDPDSYEPDA